jgi:hypothetical protein
MVPDAPANRTVLNLLGLLECRNRKIAFQEIVGAFARTVSAEKLLNFKPNAPGCYLSALRRKHLDTLADR